MDVTDTVHDIRIRRRATTVAFLRRDWITQRSYRLPFVLNTLSNGFQVVLFFFISGFIDESRPELADISGGYFGFVIVGLLMLRIVTTALNTFSSKLRTEQLTGTFEALVATPAPLPLIMSGMAVYEICYAVVTSAVMLLIAMALGVTPVVTAQSAATAALAFVSLLVLFASLGIVLAAFMAVFKQGMSALGILLQGVALLGGVYFPVEVFPRPLLILARLLPFTWGLDVLRAGVLEGRALPEVTAGLIAIAALSVPVSFWILNRAVDRARVRGSLAQY